METISGKFKIIKETLPSEIVSIIGSIIAGIILSVLILPFESFPILIIIVPALLSLRGNISGPFIARTSRDLIVGDFNSKSLFENIIATYLLALVTSIIIGLLSLVLNLFLFSKLFITILDIFLIPVLSMLFSLSVSIPSSLFLNYISFKFGLDPNNIVNPIMTAVDDFFSVLSFYFILILLGVP